MPKTAKPARQQIGVRLSEDAVLLLASLQAYYAQRGGLLEPLSQSDAVELGLRELAKTYKLKGLK